MTMTSTVEAWLAWCRIERGLLDSTIASYAADIRRLARHAAQPLETLEAEHLRAWLLAAGGSNSTVANRIAAMRSFYGFLVRSDRRKDDPTQKLNRPKVRRGLPRPVKDLAARMAHMDRDTRHVAILLRETGMRISEACSLQVAVPCPDSLIIKGKGAKERLLPLTPRARKAINALDGSVPISVRVIQRRFQRLGFSPHKLRHTFASELAASGADIAEIQDLLGHSSPATTRIYAAYSQDRLRAALERRSAMIGGGE